jgi:uncharacterized Tic20 family protein
MSDPTASTPPPPSSIPAGWYPDGQGGTRWWDGTQWGAAASAPVPATVPTTVPATASSVQDEKTLAVLAQVLAIFTGFLGPLVIYLVARPDQPFAKHHAAEALNFQITVTIAAFVSAILMLVLIGLILLPIVVIGAFVLEIIASVAASRGEWYRFPVNLRLVPGALG